MTKTRKRINREKISSDLVQMSAQYVFSFYQREETFATYHPNWPRACLISNNTTTPFLLAQSPPT